MAKPALLERLKRGPLLADGAMGTMLHQSGLRLGRCFDELNLTDPHLVASIHRQYLNAGAEIIETNTFSANDFKLQQFNLQRQTIEINEAGVEIVRGVIEASGRQDVYIAGSVGPLGTWIAPIGRVTEERAYAAFRKQIATLIYSGVDALLLETFSDLNEVSIAIRAARDVRPAVPVIANFSFTRDDCTVLGDSATRVAQHLASAGVNVLGVNCSIGPAQLLRIAGVMQQVAPDLPLAILPNAGFPEQVRGRMVYPASPDYFGEYALAFAELGARIIGGCCGTTPAHIQAMREAPGRRSPPACHAGERAAPRRTERPNALRATDRARMHVARRPIRDHG
ncbi:MAG: hypothetical protein HC915_06305 [Anaerolineae bacterium]|nr:hypothetical protein [Anaerolineae bacterium]